MKRFNAIDLVIKGRPYAQSRPHMNTETGVVYANASANLKRWRSRVAAVARGRRLEPGPVACQIIFGMPTNDRSRWFKLHSIVPDFDNLGKAVCDELQGKSHPLDDDGQIASGDILKIWSPVGFARVMMQATDDVAEVIEFKRRAIQVLEELLATNASQYKERK